MATTTLMLMTTPTIGRVVQSNQLTIMLVVVHCVEEAVREKKRKRTVKINWLRVRRLGGYKKKCFQRGTIHVYGGYTFTVYTVVLLVAWGVLLEASTDSTLRATEVSQYVLLFEWGYKTGIDRTFNRST